jgi:hypothetical protein
MEVAAAPLLKPDGHFKYQLAYGALRRDLELMLRFRRQR